MPTLVPHGDGGATVRTLVEPDGPGIRVDSGIFAAANVGSVYEPMLVKVIAHGRDRSDAIRRLDSALASTAVLGVTTNIEFIRRVLADSDVRAGRLDTGPRRAPRVDPCRWPAPTAAALAVAALLPVLDEVYPDDPWRVEV